NVEVYGDHSGLHFFLLRRSDQMRNSELLALPVVDATAAAADAPAAEAVEPSVVLPHDPSVKLQSVTAFKRHVVVFERVKGLQRIRSIPLRSDGSPAPEAAKLVEFNEAAYEIRALRSRFESPLLRYSFSSLVTPTTVFERDMDTDRQAARKVDWVGESFDPSLYSSRRLFATAADGTQVPISLVHRNSTCSAATNEPPWPMLLYAYGAYEVPSRLSFSPDRLSLLDRGVAVAIAHVRGGGDWDYQWYLDGKLLRKRNTVWDVIACAEHLIKEGLTTPDRLALEGRSAGGIPVGAAVNERPDLFRSAVAGVPFVDVLSTMLDASLHLTITEWEEWGNPQEEQYYHCIKSYSPVDNVKPQAYPNILATASLHDQRVNYWEPAKWVARLRDANTSSDSVVLLWCGTPQKPTDLKFCMCPLALLSSPSSFPYCLPTLTDQRVNYWEPAKWVARLRHANTSSDSVVLLRCSRALLTSSRSYLPPSLSSIADQRVNYWEPAKWVARLRHANTSSDSVVLLRCSRALLTSSRSFLPPSLSSIADQRVNYWEPAKWVARLRDANTSSDSVVLTSHVLSLALPLPLVYAFQTRE
ncbi:unnamed protein product, partial [Closterium sp. Naga37s-1]